MYLRSEILEGLIRIRLYGNLEASRLGQQAACCIGFYFAAARDLFRRRCLTAGSVSRGYLHVFACVKLR